MQPDPLSQLHDIHLPAAISWWPPAPLWWLLAVLVLLTAVWMLYLGLRAWQRRAFKRQALRELAHLRMLDDPHHLVCELALLVRRVALAVFPHENVASLHGQAWLQFLDRSGATQAFSQGVGRYLANIPYQRELPAEIAPELPLLVKIVKAWIRRQ
jgi:hypothetical protein